MSEKVKRIFTVCLEQSCRRCLVGTHCPPDCLFTVLHALEEDNGGLVASPSRSGKTSAIVAMAKRLLDYGMTVITISATHHMARLLRERVIKDGCSKETMRRMKTLHYDEGSLIYQGCGIPCGACMLTDELNHEEVGKVKEIFPQHLFVMGRYTP